MTLTVHAIVLDAADAAELGRFWSAALDRPLDPDPTAEVATIGVAEAQAATPGWMFLQVPEAKQAKNRVHVDFTTDDLDGEVQRLIGLGATQLAHLNEHGFRWVTLADPEGNEFDVVAGD